MFGCVVAQRKAEWHYSAGLRRERFAALLLDIWNGIRPCLTIMDGVIGMDGRGPTNGNPFPYGVVAGARDALTMDFWLCRMMGVRLEDYPLWQAAAVRGMPQCDLDENDLAGDFPASHIWEGLDIPKLDSLNLVPLMSRLPFAKILEQAMMSRPAHRPDRCVGCGKCAMMCKAEAISLSGNGKRLTFDYNKCIRCYCCHEMCPVDAIGFQEGLLMKLMKAARWIRKKEGKK
jgi:ferredoxin